MTDEIQQAIERLRAGGNLQTFVPNDPPLVGRKWHHVEILPELIALMEAAKGSGGACNVCYEYTDHRPDCTLLALAQKINGDQG